MLAIEKDDQTYYYHTDGLTSISEITDTTGAVVEKYTYDAYGTPTIKDADDNILSESVIGNRYMFTAREYDKETGLYYYRERYYSPKIGRFLQRDPLGIDDENTYTYCYNDPVNLVDPYGYQGTYGPRGPGTWQPPSYPPIDFPPGTIPTPGENTIPNPKKKEKTESGTKDISKNATKQAQKKAKDGKKGKGKKEEKEKKRKKEKGQ